MRHFGIAMAIVLAVMLAAPAFPAGAGTEKVKVLVSVSDFLPLAEAVGGSFVEVNSILPPGSDPHSFYITQNTVKQIENADLIVLADSHLLSYESNIKEDYPEKRYLDFDDYNATLDAFPGYDADPHGYWLKFGNALAIAEKIRDELSELCPEEREYFNSSFARLKLEITGAENDIHEASASRGIYGTKVVASVPGVCYIVQNMGMEVGAVLMAEGSGFASGKELGDIESKLESGEYGGIVVPEFMKEAKAGEISRQIAEDTGAKVVYVKFSMASSDDSYVNDCYHNAMAFMGLAGGGNATRESSNSYLIPVIASLILFIILQLFIIYRLYGRDEK